MVLQHIDLRLRPQVVDGLVSGAVRVLIIGAASYHGEAALRAVVLAGPSDAWMQIESSLMVMLLLQIVVKRVHLIAELLVL